MRINWKRRLFDQTAYLFHGAEKIGYLTNAIWSNNAFGLLDGKKYHFVAKGLFNPRIQIIDVEGNAIIGQIVLNEWSSKARLTFKEHEKATLFVRNFWQTQWRLSGERSNRVDYQGNGQKGQMEIKEGTPEVMALAGLYVTNKMGEYVLILVIILIIIFTSQAS